MNSIFCNKSGFFATAVVLTWLTAVVLIFKFELGKTHLLANELNIFFFVLFVLLISSAAIYFLQIEKKSDMIFLLSITALAFLLRYHLFEFRSGDYFGFLEPWFEFIREKGGFPSLGLAFSNYNPPYLYLLGLLSYFPVSSLFAVKLISVSFDALAAIVAGLLARHKYPNGIAPVLAFGAILFAPTVILNGSFWGQCDIIFTSFLTLSVYFLIKEKNAMAIITYALAFLFKLQAIFLAPLFIILFLRKKLKIWQILLFPAVYILGLTPAALAGRPWGEMLMIYFNQTQIYKLLSLNAPTIYQWLPQSQAAADIFYLPGLIFAAAAVLTLIYAVSKSTTEMNQDIIMKISAACLTLIPFLLPRMHERYFFPADIFLIIFAFYFPRYFYLPLAMQLVSFFSYQFFLFETSVNYPFLAFGMLGVALVSLYALIKNLYFETPQTKRLTDVFLR